MTKCRVLQSGDAFITQPYHMAVEPWKEPHWGIDLVRNPHNLDWIVAHSAGTVISVETSYKGTVWDNSWGNYVLVEHKNGFCTRYAHLAYGTIKVKVGDKVKQGQVLGFMGSTGPSTAAHLHFEVYNKQDIRIDPEPYLTKDLDEGEKSVFNDINKDDPNYKEYKKIYDLGIMKPDKKGNFNQKKKVTRGALAVILYRVLKKTNVIK